MGSIDNNKTWQLQNAKKSFSKVVEKAMSGKPQLVTKNGKPAVYIISAESYEKLRGSKNFKNTLLNSPHKDLRIPVDRQIDYGRKVEL